MHPDPGKTTRDGVILTYRDLIGRAAAMVSGVAWSRVRSELAVFVEPERSALLGPSTPAPHADHFVKRGPIRKGVIGGMYADEAASGANVVLERRFKLRGPSLIRGIVVPHDHGIFAKVRMERRKISARRRGSGDIDLEQPGLFQFLLEHRSRHLPLVIWAAAFAIEQHYADRVGREGKSGQSQRRAEQGNRFHSVLPIPAYTHTANYLRRRQNTPCHSARTRWEHSVPCR